MPSAPEVKQPDPKETAAAQGTLNKQTAITQALMGMTNQVTPFGSLTYTMDGNWANDFNQLQGDTPATTTTTVPTTKKEPVYRTTRDGQQVIQGYRDVQVPGTTTTTGGYSATTRGASGGPSDSSYYDVPRFTATQTLAPNVQATVDNYMNTAKNLSGSLASVFSKPLDTSGLPTRASNLTGGGGIVYDIKNAGPIQRTVGANDWSADRNDVEQAIFSRLNPAMERDRANLEANLRARGIGIGTVAYDRAMDEANRAATDARYQAVLAGGQEQSRLAGLELDQGNFRNAAQQQQYGQNANDAQFRNAAQNQAFNQNLSAAQFNNSNRSGALEEAAYLRSLPLNEINALLGGTQISKPSFVTTPTPGVAGVDYTGLVSDNYKAKLASANAANQNLFGGLASIGSGIFQGAGAAGGFGSLFAGLSDRRLKRDIMPIDAKLGRHQLYAYRYLGSNTLSFGVMADEVEQTNPEAVVTLPHGFKAVRYGMLEAA